MPDEPDSTVAATVSDMNSPASVEAEEEELVSVAEEVDLKAGLAELNAVMQNNDKTATRACFYKLTKAYSSANLIWYSWAQFELLNGDYDELEGIFMKCLKTNLYLPLWRLYLSYVRTHQVTEIADESEARQTLLKAYEFAVNHVGLDVSSGSIWTEYIEFAQSNYYRLMNEKISTWEQQQLMDLTRKIYHRALSIPMEGLESLWHAYDSYENSLNKLTAKKLVAEKSSTYMAARSATRELMDIVREIDLNAFPEDSNQLDPQERRLRLETWLRWIYWEKKNPMALANRTLVHSRLIYAYRRALMSCRRDDLMWLSYVEYLRLEAARPEDAEVVLRQAVRHCPLSLRIVLMCVDTLEAKSATFEECRSPLDRYLPAVESRLEKVKGTIIDGFRTPLMSDLDDEDVFASALLECRDSDDLGNSIAEYRSRRQDFNAAQVYLLDLSRKLSGLPAARNVFASARKSLHATSALFSASARLEFRIRKDSSIAAKIYELGVSRYSTDWKFAREYLNFLLNLNDDANIRALFERVAAAIESFRSSHSRDVIEKHEDARVTLGIWQDFYRFECQVGDYHSISKLEERMRETFPDHESLMASNVLHSRLGIQSIENFIDSCASNGARPDAVSFSLPQIKSSAEKPFHLPEPLFNFFLKVNEAVANSSFDGPRLDVNRFISFIERAALPSSAVVASAAPPAEAARDYRSRSSRSHQHQSRRRPRDDHEREDFEQQDHRLRQSAQRSGSSIFEDRRRHN